MHLSVRGFALVVAVLVASVLASYGDQSPYFRNCISQCSSEKCQSSIIDSLPLALRLTRWTCIDDCKYVCMHQITDQDIERGVQVEQYYGKWPFWRFAGMQEPASVAFSLLNLWFHAQGALKIRRWIPHVHPMRKYYLMWSLASINAWIWSSVFHTRDVSITEKLDYFSAAAAILYALYLTVVRLFHLYPHPQQNRLTLSSSSPLPASQVHRIWSIICVLVYLAHISYLTLLPRFDYTYNMAFNLSLGIAHNLLWVLYSLPAPFSFLQRFPSRPKSYRPRFVVKAAVFVVLTTLATVLEVFDFPPWARVIDAHSLWHLSTAPIAHLWYNFLIQDSLDDGWREHKM